MQMGRMRDASRLASSLCHFGWLGYCEAEGGCHIWWYAWAVLLAWESGRDQGLCCWHYNQAADRECRDLLGPIVKPWGKANGAKASSWDVYWLMEQKSGPCNSCGQSNIHQTKAALIHQLIARPATSPIAYHASLPLLLSLYCRHPSFFIHKCILVWVWSMSALFQKGKHPPLFIIQSSVCIDLLFSIHSLCLTSYKTA